MQPELRELAIQYFGGANIFQDPVKEFMVERIVKQLVKQASLGHYLFSPEGGRLKK